MYALFSKQFLWDTQIRCSDQGLHRLLTEYSIKIEKKEKNVTEQPIKRKWTCPLDKNGKFCLA